MISECGSPTEKAPEFLDYHPKLITQRGKSYIKDSGNFKNKIKSLQNILEGAILVTVDVIGLYPSISHKVGLKILREALDNWENKHISTDNLLKMVEFVLENNYFISCQVPAIGTKFATTCANNFMDKLESDFLKSQNLTPYFQALKLQENV